MVGMTAASATQNNANASTRATLGLTCASTIDLVTNTACTLGPKKWEHGYVGVGGGGLLGLNIGSDHQHHIPTDYVSSQDIDISDAKRTGSESSSK